MIERTVSVPERVPAFFDPKAGTRFFMRKPFHHDAPETTFRHARYRRRESTEAEGVLWAYLRDRGLGVKFRRQHPMATFVLDFYCHEKRLVVELDGGIHVIHDNPAYDAWRTSELERLGCRVVRFRNEEVLNELERVLAVVREWLEG